MHDADAGNDLGIGEGLALVHLPHFQHAEQADGEWSDDRQGDQGQEFVSDGHASPPVLFTNILIICLFFFRKDPQPKTAGRSGIYANILAIICRGKRFRSCPAGLPGNVRFLPPKAGAIR
ncbi:hypothetical protein D3C86_1731270 [compost metagenome]